jgi:hypothetical protein
MRNGPHLLLCSLQEPCVTPAQQALLSSINAVAVSILDAQEIDSCSSDWNSDTSVCFAGVMALRTLRARSRSSSLLTQHGARGRLGCSTCSESATGADVAPEEGSAAVPGLFHIFKVCNRCSYCNCTEEYSGTAPEQIFRSLCMNETGEAHTCTHA